MIRSARSTVPPVPITILANFVLEAQTYDMCENSDHYRPCGRVDHDEKREMNFPAQLPFMIIGQDTN